MLDVFRKTSLNTKCNNILNQFAAASVVVSYAAVLSVVTAGGALRDDTRNGCVGDYVFPRMIAVPRLIASLE